MEEQFHILTECPLCEERGLHVIGKDEQETQQCINCGFATSYRFKGFMDDTNEAYTTLPPEIKQWAKYANGRVWAPSVMTLPSGMLHPLAVNSPSGEGNKIGWAYAKMVNIPEDEQENYPDGNGGYYNRRIDIENEIMFETFLEAMVYVNDEAKHELEPKVTEMKLPKLKKK